MAIITIGEVSCAIGYGGILMGMRTRSLDNARQIAAAWKEIGGLQCAAADGPRQCGWGAGG